MEAEVLNKKKVLAPILRFKGFDENWEEKNIGSLLIIGSGKDYKHLGTGNIPVFGTGGLMAKVDDYLHDGETVCIGRKGTIDKPMFYNGKIWTVDTLFYTHSFNSVSPKFIFLIFQNINWKYYNEASGVPSLSKATIEKIVISFPSLPEQQKIASFLSAVDEKIQLLTRKKELLTQYKKGVMQQLFSGKLRFKDEQGKDFPDWEEKRLGEIADRVTIKNKNNNVSFVLTNSATQGIVSQDDYFDREIANQNNLEGYYIVATNDFVYNPRISVHAPVGPIKRNKLREGVMSPLYSIFRFKEKNLEYFEFYFETKEWHTYLESVSNIGARHDRMNISNADFLKMPIPLPCEEEREKITSFLLSLSLKIETTNKSLLQTQTFKKGLLQQMFV
jgi:type I restriction enzyme S subunit